MKLRTQLLLGTLLYPHLLQGALVADDDDLPAPAQVVHLQIDWGTAFVEQPMLLSDGGDLRISEFTIEAGTFGSGFVPTLENVEEWTANWRVFDAITASDPDPEDFAFSTIASEAGFVGSAGLRAGQVSDSEDAAISNPGFTFTPGSQGYIFLRNAETPGAGAEWALLTNLSGNGTVASDPWVFPALGGGQLQLPLRWFLVSADTAVVGAVNGGDSDGGATGGGSFADGSTDFVVRTHAIPEPAVPALLLIGLWGLLLRRGGVRIADRT